MHCRRVESAFASVGACICAGVCAYLYPFNALRL